MIFWVYFHVINLEKTHFFYCIRFFEKIPANVACVLRCYAFAGEAAIRLTRARKASTDYHMPPFTHINLSLSVLVYKKGYPHQPQTLGEHIRKKRLDLGLTQEEVAKIIGVTEDAVWGWENGGKPKVVYMPVIIKFLGYIPFTCPEDTIGRLKYFKLVNGLSFERLSEAIGKDQKQLREWLTDKVEPGKLSILLINKFLNRRK